jgi:hypothetical protein
MDDINDYEVILTEQARQLLVGNAHPTGFTSEKLGLGRSIRGGNFTSNSKVICPNASPLQVIWQPLLL